MGGNGETLIRKTVQKLPLVRVQVDVIDLIAILADKVLMFGNKRIEMLRAADSDHLKPALPDKLLQISVYGRVCLEPSGKPDPPSDAMSRPSPHPK
jgi:hypothetical protein